MRHVQCIVKDREGPPLDDGFSFSLRSPVLLPVRKLYVHESTKSYISNGNFLAIYTILYVIYTSTHAHRPLKTYI